ncbi:hypothetical protein [endosymbiont 'TC1' of Trimyema compressum]|uniref:hypothetical protein n=1 Tax=endosymbiont 'TC1' of Trimyema compressum TaxID=243899 RepID=UPI00316AE5F2
MLKDFAYKITEKGLQDLLTNIKKTTIITTSSTDKKLAKRAIENGLINSICSDIGISNIVWLHCSNTKKRRNKENYLLKK